MISCDEALALVLTARADATVAHHIAICTQCAADAPVVQALAGGLATGGEAEGGARIDTLCRSAMPLLAAHRVRREATWPLVGRALAAAAVALLVAISIDVRLFTAAHAVLAAVLPAALATALVASFAATTVVLLATSVAAAPLLAERQIRHAWEMQHA